MRELNEVIVLGKVAYTNPKYRNNLVDIQVKLTEKPKGLVFTMSGNVWDSMKTDIVSGGRMCYELPTLFPGNPGLKRLVRIWEEWHLNDLNAGTARQELALKERVNKPKSHSYTEDCEYLKSIDLHIDNGYAYGTAWLFQEIPNDIVEEIHNIVNQLKTK